MALGYVTEWQMNNVLRQKKTNKIGNRPCQWLHPDHAKLKSMLAAISRRLTKGKFSNDQEFPKLRQTDRSNRFLKDDFARFEDGIIEGFMLERPISSWGIDWDWVADEGYVDPFSP